MSEEEIINILENLWFDCEDFGIRNSEALYKDDVAEKAIQGILDLYQKEKEKNKDIKEELERQINTRTINEEFIEKNFISKDKIKTKIEELEKDMINYKLCTTVWLQLGAEIDVLQELLEEE